MKLEDLNEVQLEILKRFARNEESFSNGVKWLACGLTQVKTETAFQLATGGRDVFAIYADGTDAQLDDLESMREYYEDLSKSWPEIETIFVVEGEL